jgi:hypothetical protein
MIITVLLIAGMWGSVALADGLESLNQGLTNIDKATTDLKGKIDKAKAPAQAVRDKTNQVKGVKDKADRTVGQAKGTVEDVKNIAR